MNSPIEEIRKAVVENRTGDALSLLLTLSEGNKQFHDSVHIVLGEFHAVTSQTLNGTIERSETNRRVNIIHDKILFALNSFDSQGTILPEHVVSRDDKHTLFFKKYGLILLFTTILFAVVGFLFCEISRRFDVRLGNFIGLMLGATAYYVGMVSLIFLSVWLVSIIIKALAAAPTHK